MTSLNAHSGPVDFLVATSSMLSPDLLKRDSVSDRLDSASDPSAAAREEKKRSTSPESLQQASGSPQPERRPKGVLLQYRLRSTSQLPGKLLSAEPGGPTASPAPFLQDWSEHGPEDGSIYELSDDPEIWVRGRTVLREGFQKERVASAAVVSGGRGFRRLNGAGLADCGSSGASPHESTLMVWQLPLTVWASDSSTEHLADRRVSPGAKCRHILSMICQENVTALSRLYWLCLRNYYVFNIQTSFLRFSEFTCGGSVVEMCHNIRLKGSWGAIWM